MPQPHNMFPPPSASRMIILLLIWCGTSFNQTPVFSQDYDAPSTISPEARNALSKFSRAAATAPLPAADDLAGWKAMQAKIEQKRAVANAEVVKTYQPQITERKLGGVPVLDIKPKGWKESNQVLVYTHGGAYTMYIARSRLMSAVPMANDTGFRVISIDYTLAPVGKWQQVTDQVVTVIQTLIQERHSLNKIAV